MTFANQVLEATLSVPVGADAQNITQWDVMRTLSECVDGQLLLEWEPGWGGKPGVPVYDAA